MFRLIRSTPVLWGYRTPLRDGYHFGQTITNDYDRPYWRDSVMLRDQHRQWRSGLSRCAPNINTPVHLPTPQVLGHGRC